MPSNLWITMGLYYFPLPKQNIAEVFVLLASLLSLRSVCTCGCNEVGVRWREKLQERLKKKEVKQVMKSDEEKGLLNYESFTKVIFQFLHIHFQRGI